MSEKIKPVPHKHAAVIKAWADGHVVQLQCTDGTWVDLPGSTTHSCIPAFASNFEYRIKPEPTDLERYGVEVGDVWLMDDKVKLFVHDLNSKLAGVYELNSTYHVVYGISKTSPRFQTLLFRRGKVNKL